MSDLHENFVTHDTVRFSRPSDPAGDWTVAGFVEEKGERYYGLNPVGGGKTIYWPVREQQDLEPVTALYYPKQEV